MDKKLSENIESAIQTIKDGHNQSVARRNSDLLHLYHLWKNDAKALEKKLDLYESREQELFRLLAVSEFTQAQLAIKYKDRELQKLRELADKQKAELKNIIYNCRTLPDDPERTARILKLLNQE